MRPRNYAELFPVIESQLLLKDLKDEVTKLEDDIHARCDADAAADALLQAQYEAGAPGSARH